MKWSHFLHIYQPSDQHPGTLEKIVNESYRPLIRGLYKSDKAKITLNINAVLAELLFKNGYRDVIEDIKQLVDMGKVELTGSGKYHAFLPLIPEAEVRRQISMNHETNSRYFGKYFQPKGFFSPEMAYSPKVASIAREFGYEWILADEVALCKEDINLVNNNRIFRIKELEMNVFFREKYPTNLIMGALVRSVESFKRALGDRIKSNGYVITAMDGETFGHHRPGLENAFFEILDDPEFENVFISDLPNIYRETVDVMPLDSTWASSEKEVKEGVPYVYWSNKGNQIHKYEWDLASIAIKTVSDSKYSDKHYPHMLEEIMDWEQMTEDQRVEEERKRQWVQARDLLDKALNSDPWWWACAVPWWSVEMIEKGMYALYKVVLSVPDSLEEDRSIAEDYYKQIIFTAHEWQRTGKVDQMESNASEIRRIPLSKRFGAGAHYQALMDALKEEEQKASSRREYEQAIKWRDSQYKLERDLDIYDAVHVIELIREEGNFKRFDELLEEYRKKFKNISKGQPE